MLLVPVTSRPAVDFIAALAAAAATQTPPFVGSAIYNVLGVPPAGSRRFFVRAIGFTAVESIGLEYDFYDGAAGNFLGKWQFAKADGAQKNGAGAYQYYVDGLAIPYVDLDTIGSQNPPTLHVAIQNVDTTAKSAAGAGAVTATFWLEPMTGSGGNNV